MEKALVLFDDCCNLCSGSVQFITRRDSRDYFRFVSIHSDLGGQLLRKCRIDSKKTDTIVLIEGRKCLTESDAAIGIALKLGGLWPAFSIFRIIPRLFRDRLYYFIARNRYLFFGRSDKCLLPSGKHSRRFLQ